MPLDSAATNQLAKATANALTRRIWWAMSRKSAADKILKHIEDSNKYLRQFLADRQLANFDNPQVQSAPEHTATSNTPAVTQTGFSTQRTRLLIQRGRIPPNRNMLRPPSFLQMNSESLLEDHSCIRTAKYMVTRSVLVESYQVGDFSDKSESKAIQLAMLLSQPRVAGFGVLKCEGLVYKESDSRCEFIFDERGVFNDLREYDIPFSTAAGLTSNFRSLNFHLSKQPGSDGAGPSPRGSGSSGVFQYPDLLADTPYRPISLLERMVFARSLAQTVNQLHLAQWVHGNIASRNILFLQDLESDISSSGYAAATAPGASATRLGRPYLFGFQFTHLSDDYSTPGSWTWVERRDNVYRHPERQVHCGRAPGKPHSPWHDVYSLGVVFLEIGLGRTAEELLEIGKSLKQRPAADPTSSASAAAASAASSVPSGSTQEVFLDVAHRLLPRTMGEAFAQVTEWCLAGKSQEGSDNREREREVVTALLLEDEVTLSTAFWICVMKPLDGLIDAMSAV